MSEWQFSLKKALMHSEEDSQSLNCWEEQNQVKYVLIYYLSAAQGLSLLNPCQRDNLNASENDLIQFPQMTCKIQVLSAPSKRYLSNFKNKCTFTSTNGI